jgi:hypothetical protein
VKGYRLRNLRHDAWRTGEKRKTPHELWLSRRQFFDNDAANGTCGI